MESEARAAFPRHRLANGRNGRARLARPPDPASTSGHRQTEERQGNPTEKVHEMPTVKDGVYVMLAPGFEETDVSTVTRTLRRSGFLVAVVGLTAGPLRGAYGLSLASDGALSEVEKESPRAVVLPGGVQASRKLGADPRVHGLLRRVVGQGGYVVAIDNAYTVLRSAGVLYRDGFSRATGLWATRMRDQSTPGLADWRLGRLGGS